jgi:hypothetical protein
VANGKCPVARCKAEETRRTELVLMFGLVKGMC